MQTPIPNATVFAQCHFLCLEEQQGCNPGPAAVKLALSVMEAGAQPSAMYHPDYVSVVWGPLRLKGIKTIRKQEREALKKKRASRQQRTRNISASAASDFVP